MAKGSYRVQIIPGVAPGIAAEVRRLMRGFHRASGIRHRLEVIVIPSHCYEPYEGYRTWGCYFHPLRNKKLAHIIYVAGLVPRNDRRRGYVKAGPARCVGFTLLHELAHYEQYRDGKPMVERGRNVRAAGLYRLIDKEN